MQIITKIFIISLVFKKSYDQHLDQVIRDLIHRQDCVVEKTCPAPGSGFAKHVTNPHTNTSADVIADFDAYVDQQVIHNAKVNKDFLIPSKTRGFLNHQSADFEFIGPDRAPVLINSVQTCLEVANIIRDSGFPNYRVSRIPLVSDLVIKAWEYYLRDYPDKILINYLKFGFSLSINDHTKLANTNINNHASTMHFPNAIAEYIAKEKDCGAMLGPGDKVNSPHYHCSRILTRPKDDNKRRVIVNLSYPSSQSLNDQVTREMFDNRPFTLKFPKIEDIVDQILITKDPMLFKIDVARAFRNLRADPVDAVKLGICWADKWYIDLAIVFGWAGGTSAFQMVADAISFIMAKENCKIFAYMDDFIAVAPRPVAVTHFQKLSDLLTELGLPMNPQKKTPPCRSLTCLGITIDIDATTLQIKKSKLQAIYEAWRHKKFLSKKTFQSLIGKLIYVHKCVQPAQISINRILALFRNNAHKKRIKLNEEFFKDIHWFLTFLPSYNGITYFDKQDVEHCDSLYLDASLSELGAIWANRVYSTPVLAIPGFTFTIVILRCLI